MDKNGFQLRLRVAWFKNFLGLAIDQVSLEKQYALTPYYFWPKTDAWEQLKLELDSKIWLTPEEKIALLKPTAELMKYWLSCRDEPDIKIFQEKFEKMEFVMTNN